MTQDVALNSPRIWGLSWVTFVSLASNLYSLIYNDATFKIYFQYHTNTTMHKLTYSRKKQNTPNSWSWIGCWLQSCPWSIWTWRLQLEQGWDWPEQLGLPWSTLVGLEGLLDLPGSCTAWLSLDLRKTLRLSCWRCQSNWRGNWSWQRGWQSNWLSCCHMLNAYKWSWNWQVAVEQLGLLQLQVVVEQLGLLQLPIAVEQLGLQLPIVVEQLGLQLPIVVEQLDPTANCCGATWSATANCWEDAFLAATLGFVAASAACLAAAFAACVGFATTLLFATTLGLAATLAFAMLVFFGAILHGTKQEGSGTTEQLQA